MVLVQVRTAERSGWSPRGRLFDRVTQRSCFLTMSSLKHTPVFYRLFFKSTLKLKEEIPDMFGAGWELHGQRLPS